VEESLAAGVARAREAVDSGAAAATLERWVAATSR
jgi:anthranilate phosphoribosyltransferase